MISDLPANRSIPSFSSEPAKTVDSGLCHQIGQTGQNRRFPPFASSASRARPELRPQRSALVLKFSGVAADPRPPASPASNLHVPQLPPSSEAPPALQPSRRPAATSKLRAAGQPQLSRGLQLHRRSRHAVRCDRDSSLRPLLEDVGYAGDIGDPRSCVGIYDAGELEQVVVAILDRPADDRLVMRDPVTKRQQP